jgi:hypothetical protein
VSVAGIDTLLRDIVAILGGIGVPHMVVGSFASTFHGDPRTTRGLDLVIDPTREQLEALLVRLSPDRYYVDADVARDALRRRTMFNVIDTTTAWKLDLIVRKPRPFSVEELRRRRPVMLFGIEVDTATAEDTILSKLEWAKLGGSERQLQDVAGILRLRADTLDVEYIERWAADLDVRDQWDRARKLFG